MEITLIGFKRPILGDAIPSKVLGADVVSNEQLVTINSQPVNT